MGAVLCCGAAFDPSGLTEENYVYSWLDTLLESHDEKVPLSMHIIVSFMITKANYLRQYSGLITECKAFQLLEAACRENQATWWRQGDHPKLFFKNWSKYFFRFLTPKLILSTKHM
jgi:hypothetical protein